MTDEGRRDSALPHAVTPLIRPLRGHLPPRGKAKMYLPDALRGHKFYDPGNNARESEIRRRLQSLWKKYNY